MNINSIFNFSKKDEQKNYTSSFKRATASSFDVVLVLILRIFVAQLLGDIWFKDQVVLFLQEFKDHFGTDIIKNNQSHIDFIIHHSIFLQTIIYYSIIIFIGTLYHALMNASSWQATIGKRMFRIIMINKEGRRISVGLGMQHYFLSILPFVYIFYLVAYQAKNGVTFFHAVTASEANVFLGICFILWTQIHLFTKEKVTAYDIICKTKFINGRTEAKFPWTKIKIK